MGFDATCSLVALDRNARPLSVSPNDAPERDVIVWMDHRAIDDAERINAGGHEALRYVGAQDLARDARAEAHLARPA